MPGFVKLDADTVRSSLWIERDLRSVFITALLIAEPYELEEPTPQLKVRALEETDWIVPPGWYGLVRAAGTAIVQLDGCDKELGLRKLEELGSPDPDSRTQDFEGRRMVRISGGYLILNYMKYRDRDYTAADRMRRLRERRKKAGSGNRDSRDSHDVTRNGDGVTPNITDAESREQRADAELKTDVVEGATVNNSTDLSTSPAIRLTRMLNRGMGDNPAIGETYNPVLATSGHTLEAVEQLEAAKVPVEFAETWIYSLAVAYKPRKLGDQVRSLVYLVPAVVDAWQRRLAKTDASTASPPAGALNGDAPTYTPSRNGTSDAKGRGMLIFGELRAAVREVTVWNDPNDHGAGNRLDRRIPDDALLKLDQPAQKALLAIGGARAIELAASDRVDNLSWRFAAAYQAASNG